MVNTSLSVVKLRSLVMKFLESNLEVNTRSVMKAAEFLVEESLMEDMQFCMTVCF